MEALTQRIDALWTEAQDIWLSGGWAMVAIAVIALAMFGMGTHIYFRLRATGFRAVDETTWRRWISHPREREGRVGEMLDFVTGGRSITETANLFDQLRSTETLPFERDLKVMKICVSAAPLVGLLGTVTGMLATFGALSSGSGGDKTMALVAKGISEALITTETGLVIALPGLFFQYQLERNFERYKAFLAHVESACMQAFQRDAIRAGRVAVQRAAKRRVARELYARWAANRARGAAPTAAHRPDPGPAPTPAP